MKQIPALAITAILLFALPLCAHGGELVISAVGDIMLAGKWAPLLREKGYDHPFGGVAAALADSDINLANLESPIASGGREYTSKRFGFRAEQEVAKAVRKAGFNLVNLANNHSMDFGGGALAETMANLEAAGIAWIGAGEDLAEARKMALFNVKGKKIAFLGYSLTQPVEFFAAQQRPGTAPGYEHIFVPDIAKARREADYVIVSFSLGQGGAQHPAPLTTQHCPQGHRRRGGRDNRPSPTRAAGHRALRERHHLLQSRQLYLCQQGHGNRSERHHPPAVGRCPPEAEILPLDVLYRRVGFQPRLLSGKPAADVIEQLNFLSKPLNTEIKSKNNAYVVSF